VFRITSGKGFHMAFENGWTISVQFGTGNYCDNRTYELYTPEEDRRVGRDGSLTAEIAAWGADGERYNFGDDTVKGWVSANEVVKWMHKFANMPTG
jgi:hypothetical protein